MNHELLHVEMGVSEWSQSRRGTAIDAKRRLKSRAVFPAGLMWVLVAVKRSWHEGTCQSAGLSVMEHVPKRKGLHAFESSNHSFISTVPLSFRSFLRTERALAPRTGGVGHLGFLGSVRRHCPQSTPCTTTVAPSASARVTVAARKYDCNDRNTRDSG